MATSPNALQMDTSSTYAKDSRNKQKDCEKENYLSVANIVLMSQQKQAKKDPLEVKHLSQLFCLVVLLGLFFEVNSMSAF